jgi:hypothetical protein
VSGRICLVTESLESSNFVDSGHELRDNTLNMGVSPTKKVLGEMFICVELTAIFYFSVSDRQRGSKRNLPGKNEFLENARSV